MKSIKDIYKIGKGPSSSHTMGPAAAMEIFVRENPDVDHYEVTLFGSLADTGEGHGTDKAITAVAAAVGKDVNITLNTVDRDLPHENTLDIYAVKGGTVTNKMRVMSVGGGDIEIEGRPSSPLLEVYTHKSLTEIAE